MTQHLADRLWRAQSRIEFREADHTYWDGARQVASVSEVLKAAGLGSDYSAIDPDVLARAAARGVHVEAACELWWDGILDETSVHPEAVPYLRAFARFVETQPIHKASWQLRGYDPACDVAGTADVHVTFHDGGDALVDLKCTTKIDRSYRLQLVAYRRMLGAPDTKRWILHLRRDATYQLRDCDAWEREEGANDEATWLGAVALYRWKHHGNGKR